MKIGQADLHPQLYPDQLKVVERRHYIDSALDNKDSMGTASFNPVMQKTG